MFHTLTWVNDSKYKYYSNHVYIYTQTHKIRAKKFLLISSFYFNVLNSNLTNAVGRRRINRVTSLCQAFHLEFSSSTRGQSSSLWCARGCQYFSNLPKVVWPNPLATRLECFCPPARQTPSHTIHSSALTATITCCERKKEWGLLSH